MSTLPKKNSRKPNPVTRLSTFQKWLMFLGMFVLIFTTLPAVIVIFIGLLPTITVVITDPKNTTKLIVIGCFNMSGVFFCIMSIIDQFNLREAFFIVGNIFNLVIMLDRRPWEPFCITNFPTFLLPCLNFRHKKG